MKTYGWAVYNADGEPLMGGQIIIEANKKIVDVIKEIEKKNDVKIGDFHEFRLKEI